jgi:hypothetical protein
VTPSDGGKVLGGRTLPPPVLSPGVAEGIVPVSAHEALDLTATRIELRTRLADGRSRRRELVVAATTRASGLANVALDHPVLLRGHAVELIERPESSRAELRRVADLFELVPDAPGRYLVQGAGAEPLVIQSGRYDATPLDCGRAGCHEAIAESALQSPMTHALERDLGPRALADPGCALACHATGEPGVDDGGFFQVLGELSTPMPRAYTELPRALRRLGGVGCLACHGPGAIPELGFRHALLSASVCAVCHDAPPAYGHARAFSGTRMARADREPATREGSCARCHTAFGALGRDTHRPPAGASFGIGCVACHDVHSRGSPDAAPLREAPRHLLRKIALPPSLGDVPSSLLGPSRVCLACHAPSPGAAMPEASAAALLLGRGGSEPRAGASLPGPSPHAADARGCLACHASGPEGLGRGRSHAFQVGSGACLACHAVEPARDPSLARRARALFARLSGSPSEPVGLPPHAGKTRLPDDGVLSRAFANVALVLEDPAADVHNPRYATLLLDAAEAALAARPSGPARTNPP